MAAAALQKLGAGSQPGRRSWGTTDFCAVIIRGKG